MLIIKFITVRLSVPIARPEVWEDEPSTAHLRWQPAYIPSYHSLRPKRYRIEMQEAGPTSIASDWKPVADDVTTPDFTVKDLSPRKDYNFRIRAEMENGDISEPTPPIQYYRSQGREPHYDHVTQHYVRKVNVGHFDMCYIPLLGDFEIEKQIFLAIKLYNKFKLVNVVA